MKMLMWGVALSLGALASSAQADQIVTVDGEDYFLSHLMANCQSITDDPEAQIACFGAISQLLEEQSDEVQQSDVSIPEKLEALRTVAQYQDDETGLSIVGADCNVHIVYFNNYFHISRRNISELDLFSASFAASKLSLDQTRQAQAPFAKGVMETGSNAVIRGGIALDSGRDNFEPRSPRSTLAAYANEVVGQLQPREAQEFDFVLVHPNRSQNSAEIWTAFEAYVDACNG